MNTISPIYYTTRSFATAATGNCNKNVKGEWCWTGITNDKTIGGTKTHIYDSVCGKDCNEARSKFCQKQGGCLGTTGQKPIVGVADPVGGSTSLTKAVLGGDNSPVANTVNNFLNSSGGTPSVNPASGCQNCGSDTWNPANWGCQLGKLSCEFTHSVGGTFGDFGQYIPYIAIGGAAILLIVLLKR